MKRAAALKAKYDATKDFTTLAMLVVTEYTISIHFLGENSLANAKNLGALDAKKLYPDIAQVPFKKYAKAFYGEG